MIILASTNSSAIYSGLIAAIVSGIVSGIGYWYSAKIQRETSKETIATQKEIAQMNNNEKLFYETQIRWNDEVRKLFAKYVKQCFILNRDIKEVKEIKVPKGEKANEVTFEKLRLKINRQKELTDSAMEQIYGLQETVSLIRLYLFNDDNTVAKILLQSMLNMIQHYGKFEPVSTMELNDLIENARVYLDEQMRLLKDKQGVK